MARFRSAVKTFTDFFLGSSHAMSEAHLPVAPNRKMRRAELAKRQAVISAPARRKHEKRGASGRSSKGRKPHRVS